MTYKELLESLQKLSQDQLEANVSVYDCELDEYLPSHDFTFTVGDDVLDDNHPILLIK